MLFAHQFFATGSLLPAFFCVDVSVTAIAAWLLVCGWGHARHGMLEAALAWRIIRWTHQGGPHTVVHPERPIGAKVVDDWRLWPQSLVSKESPLMLALPDVRVG